MIEVSHLTKRYGSHTAVRDLSFTIHQGEIYGFLGPNGAGKSTTMNIITGCLAATSGQVTVGGQDIFEEPQAAKRLIGYLPEQPPLYQEMTPEEYLDFVAGAKGLKGEAAKRDVDRVMELTGITDVSGRLIRNLSKGYRQRVGIAQALLGDPEVVMLDEPTVGLDPKQIIEIRDLIRTLGQEHTVILSSHILSEVQAVCSRILIISHGELVASDTPENLERRFAASGALHLTVRATQEETQKALSTLEGVRSLQYEIGEDGLGHVTVDADTDDALCERVFFAFSALGRPILQMTTQRATLEDVFLELTESGQAEPEPERRSWFQRRKNTPAETDGAEEREENEDAGDL